MSKIWGWAVVLMLTIVFGAKEVSASGFHLSSIESIETNGQQLSHWWYTGYQPTFRGEALPSAEVVVNIDGTSRQINADSAGSWAFKPEAALAAGDHQVAMTSNGSEVKFTLTLGSENVDWNAVGSGSADTLPTVGTSWPTMMIMLLGGGFLVLSGKMVFDANREK